MTSQTIQILDTGVHFMAHLCILGLVFEQRLENHTIVSRFGMAINNQTFVNWICSHNFNTWLASIQISTVIQICKKIVQKNGPTYPVCSAINDLTYWVRYATTPLKTSLGYCSSRVDSPNKKTLPSTWLCGSGSFLEINSPRKQKYSHNLNSCYSIVTCKV